MSWQVERRNMNWRSCTVRRLEDDSERQKLMIPSIEELDANARRKSSVQRAQMMDFRSLRPFDDVVRQHAQLEAERYPDYSSEVDRESKSDL